MNDTLTEGEMPIELNYALVYPNLKKLSLCKDTINNYRPISHLPQLSEVITKVVATRLITHLVNQSLTDPFQSAYKHIHSTKSTLLCVVNDIRMALDHSQSTIVMLIDLNAAFETIDHNLLLDRLQ